MRVTFKPIVLRHQRRKDNTFPVIIRIGFASKYSRLQTKFLASRNDLSRTLEIKNATILDKCNVLIKEYREIIDNSPVEFSDIKEVVGYIERKLKQEDDIDYLLFFKAYFEKVKAIDSKKAIYSATCNHLSGFINNDRLSIKTITPKFLSDFEKYLDRKGVGNRGQNLHIGTVRIVYNN